MPTFVTTIQLHDADESDYNKLYNELTKKSTKKGRHAVQSKRYITGKIEYKQEGDVTIQEVTDTVFRAVTKTGKKYSFTITRNNTIDS